MAENLEGDDKYRVTNPESSATLTWVHNKRPLGACVRVTPLTAGDQWRPEDNRMTPSKCWEGIKICQLRFLYLATTPSAYKSELKMLSGQQNLRGCQPQAPSPGAPGRRAGHQIGSDPEKIPEGHELSTTQSETITCNVLWLAFKQNRTQLRLNNNRETN